MFTITMKIETCIATCAYSSVIHFFTAVKMSAVLIGLLFVNLGAGCWSFRIRPGEVAAPTTGYTTTEYTTSYTTPPNTTVTPPVCPTTKKGLQYGGVFPDLPAINVTAEVQRNGFCTLPYSVEEFHQRLKFDPDTRYNAVSMKSFQVHA